jgi:hypothetical protein
MRDDHPGGPIRWRIHLPVPPERVFATLDSSEGRAAFWAESAMERDGVIEFQFINGYRYESSVVERRPPQVWAIEYIGGLARFELVSDGQGGTDVLLTHSGLSPSDWNEVHAGWLNVLFPLKAFLAHGIDLRNHDPRRSWDQGYVDQ